MPDGGYLHSGEAKVAQPALLPRTNRLEKLVSELERRVMELEAVVGIVKISAGGAGGGS